MNDKDKEKLAWWLDQLKEEGVDFSDGFNDGWVSALEYERSKSDILVDFIKDTYIKGFCNCQANQVCRGHKVIEKYRGEV